MDTRHGTGQHLATVAQQQDHIGTAGFHGVDEGLGHAADVAGHGRPGRRLQRHRDAGTDLKAGGLDLAHSLTVEGRQVHAGGDHLDREGRMVANGLKRRAHQAEVGAGAGDVADTAHGQAR